jgi:hypothetical protein
LINNNTSNTGFDIDTSSSTEHLSQNIIQENEDGRQNKNISLSFSYSSTSNSSKSPVDRNPVPPERTSSTPSTLINFILPRPPPPILRNLNIEHSIDPLISEETANNQNNDNSLLIRDKENEFIDDYTSEKNETIQADVRRGTRIRTKNKRGYSPELNERSNSSTAKTKKKSNKE